MIVDGSEGSLKQFLRTLPPVDQVGAEGRAAMLATRSIKTTSKNWAIFAIPDRIHRRETSPPDKFW